VDIDFAHLFASSGIVSGAAVILCYGHFYRRVSPILLRTAAVADLAAEKLGIQPKEIDARAAILRGKLPQPTESDSIPMKIAEKFVDSAIEGESEDAGGVAAR
jgi:hypothetical protein